MIRDEFVKMLRCPITKRPLAVAERELVESLNELVASGSLSNRAGDAIDEPLEGGLVEATAGWFYPVWGSIPSLVPDEAISLQANDREQERT